MSRPTKALIDLTALRHNYRLAQALAPASNNIAIIKANAYGHGAIPIAKSLDDLASTFGVACIEEALDLREAGIKQPILLLEGAFTEDELDIAAKQNFWLVIDNQNQLDAILNAKLPSKLTVWLGIDSGMHRLGFQPDQVQQAFRQLEMSNNVYSSITVASHFACADELDNSFTSEQISCFNQALEGLTASHSLANSAGLLAWPEAHRTYNRPGYMLYGATPFNVPQENADKLKPVMTLQSAIISLRDVQTDESVGYGCSWTAQRPSQIATIAIGYGDGYPRHAPSGTPVIINDERCPLVGRVSMDMITVDVTDLKQVAIGDPVELWGNSLSVNEVATHAGTIGYELLTRMPMRTPRVYVDGSCD